MTPGQNERQPVAAADLHDILAMDPVQVDDGFEESIYNDSLNSASFMTSLNSSILNYKYENGRRYHAFREGTYLVPNDEEEQDRMDLAHHIYRLLLGGDLYLAPIKEDVQRVLDLGTGTGIWAIDFADEHPSAQVIGTDLSPIQPRWVPPTCTFEIDDYESDWLYTRPFDFIHARELEGCIGNDIKFFKQAFKHLAPGGYLEVQAVTSPFLSDDDSLDKAANLKLWMANIVEGLSKFGKPIDNVGGWKDKLKDVGFVDVHQEIRKLPIGPWPKDPKLKEIGKYQGVQELQVIDSYTPAVFSRILGWSQTELQVLMAKVKSELKDPSVHVYLPVYFIYGRKPL
ncbi:S-adenosyl-L-methionine-dependent methyltransferase [Aspergillus coremiiformis]|uniref:S-adenosyl-L-methionine-dependent methyltransferase n=1 Tax=Aspergillus coremiiformis TaxID=138285 RepID=A0A5N6Z728_9EURO|nr:S-adenosyl-L-methionine-dependent methyltransferase [Aspergillus coremiiformis]